MSNSNKLPPLIILCGGKGTRISHLSNGVPKGLLDINGTSVVEDQCIRFAPHHELIILATGYLGEQYLSLKSKLPFNNILVEQEERPLGTGGALRKVVDKFEFKSFFVVNGDTFIDVDTREMIKSWKINETEGVLGVAKISGDLKDFGNISLDKSDIITSFSEKTGRGEYVYGGVGLLSANVFMDNALNSEFSLEEEIFMNSNNRFQAYMLKNGFYDIGTEERLRKIRKSQK